MRRNIYKSVLHKFDQSCQSYVFQHNPGKHKPLWRNLCSLGKKNLDVSVSTPCTGVGAWGGICSFVGFTGNWSRNYALQALPWSWPMADTDALSKAAIAKNRTEFIEFAKSEALQVRDDYQKLIFSSYFLESSIQENNVIHLARRMAKGLYAIFRIQLILTNTEERGILDICLFSVPCPSKLC